MTGFLFAVVLTAQNNKLITVQDYINNSGNVRPAYLDPSLTPAASCNNLDFETGSFSGWKCVSGMNLTQGSAPQLIQSGQFVGYTNQGGWPYKTGFTYNGYITGYGPPTLSPYNCPSQIIANVPIYGPMPNYHSIVSAGVLDQCGGFPKSHPSGNFSALLNNDAMSPSGNMHTQTIYNRFFVSAANPIIVYNYACVLVDGGHSVQGQAFFEAKVVMASDSQTVIPCTYFRIAAGSAGSGLILSQTCNKGICFNPSSQGADTIPSYLTSTYSYIPWSTRIMDLTSYIGQEVMLVFTASDCNEAGHAGWAYVDAHCTNSTPEETISVCSPPAKLWAPAASGTGATTYSWGPTPPVPAGWPANFYNATTEGTYTVTSTKNGCSQTLKYIVDFTGSLIPDFTMTSPSCGSTTVTFTDVTPGTPGTWTWNFGDGQTSNLQHPSHTYGSAGNYTVTLTVTDGTGCTGTVSKPVTFGNQPTASFTPNPACAGSPTTFNSTSTPAAGGGAINSYTWNFGDASGNGSGQSPSHTYTNPGTYTVTLTIGDANGCTATISNTITVPGTATAAFTSSPVCVGSPMTFTNSSSGATQYTWNFGDPGSGANNTSTQTSPVHTYTTSGSFTVTLTASAAGGACANTVTQVVNVTNAITPDITATSVCIGNPTVFGTSVTAANYTWNFGDSQTSTSQNPSHTYATAGTYTVTLNTSEAGGACPGTATHIVTVTPGNAPDATASTVCIGSPTVFTSTTTAVNYTWSFGDGGTATTQNPSHTYATAGTYTASLTVSGAGGSCPGTVSTTVTVTTNAVADFTSTPDCAGLPVTFADQSAGGGVSWNWDFGDGNTSTTANPTHTYATAGTYTVILTVSGGANCNDTEQKTITIVDGPTALFATQNVCLTNPTTFINNSTNTNGTSTYSWTFGDGQTSTQAAPTHTYTASGTYTVDLIVANGTCTDTHQQTVQVFPPATADYSTGPVCLGNTTNFIDLSTVTGGTVSSYSWNFGDGTNSTQQSPSHSYTTSSTYSVTLSISTSTGCQATTTHTVLVYDPPVAAFDNNTVCVNGVTQFQDQSQNNPNQWAWDFGDGVTSASQNPTHIYTTAGTYTVTLTASNGINCSDTETKTVVVNSAPVVDFSADDTSGCSPLCVSFTDASTVNGSTIASWQWTLANGGVLNDSPNPKYCYTTPGYYDVGLTVVSAAGCASTYTWIKMIHVYPDPVADFNPNPQPATVEEPTINFSDNSSGDAVEWYWAFGDGDSLSNLITDPQHIYYPDEEGQTFLASLTVVNQYGCRDFIEKPVIFKPDWTIYVPNTFTPNGDGKNDFFAAKGKGIIEFQMWIYDRWGNEIFETKDIFGPWNGKVQYGASGELAQIDTYVWVIWFTDIDNKRHNMVGHVNLIR